MPAYVTRTLADIEHRLDLLKLKLKARFDRFAPVFILPYRGFSNGQRLWFRGRLMEDRGLDSLTEHASMMDNLMNSWRRYETDEIPGARLEIAVGDERHWVETDDEGFFDLDITLAEGTTLASPQDEVRVWLRDSITDQVSEEATIGQILTPPLEAEFGVISDLDDTVVKTGATDLLQHFSTVLLNNAQTREPFAGVAAFYQALQAGASGNSHNPLFYVSSSPWNLYGLFEDFMDAHAIPQGPIFLKEFGLDEGKFIKSGHDEYKIQRVTNILDTYPDLPFILIGDSGQRDAFVYHRVVMDHPGQVRAVYLRDLTPENDGDNYHDIEREVEDQGVPLLHARDSHEAARHAAAQGWIQHQAWMDEEA